MSSRTDRVLIAVALIILLLTLGGIFGFDSIFSSGKNRLASSAVAEIVSGKGDVRVKYNDEIRWQKSGEGEKLLINDSIFAGENSQIDLAIGESKLKLESNTLIVLRKDTVFNSLNLNYGGLSGILAKNDKLIVETSNGEKFEMNANASTKIAIHRRAGKTEVKVIEGNARVIKDGKAQNLSSRDSVVFEEKFKADPLKFSEPAQFVLYSTGANESVRFSWGYTSGRTIDAGDKFILEFSSDPAFRELALREEILGAREFSPSLAYPQSLYYRVKDASGNHSETRRLQLLAPQTPAIVSPVAGSVFDAEPGQSLPVKIETSALQPESKIILQVASDADFNTIVGSKTLLDPQTAADLPAGEYFLRARAEFKQINLDGTIMQTGWSVPVPISVRDRLDRLALEQIRLPSIVTIPNRKYPPTLYSAAAPAVQNHLKEMPAFSQFFAPLMVKGHDLVAHRGRTGEKAVRVDGPNFPTAWIAPGNLNLKYQLQTHGKGSAPAKAHTMRIEMEAPNELRADDKGNLSWSPILFAHGYEGEIRHRNGKSSAFKAKRAAHFARLQPGSSHSFRVRALNAKSRPISDWSPSHAFQIAKPPPEPEIQLTEQSPALEREPAQEPANTSTLAVEEKKLTAWQKVGYWLWFGSGMNFYDVRQTVNNQADVTYQNLKGPSFFAEGGYLAKSRLGAILGYKRTPGTVHLDNHPVNNPNFVWDTISLEAVYGLPYVGHFLKQTLNWGIRIGVQNHSFPFLYIETGRTVNTSQSQILAGSLGFFMETTGRWKQHWHMRYQQPLQSSTDGGNSFEIKPKIAFDGSIGTSYMLTERFKTGLFWYGQMHAYDFVYRSQTQTNSGSQSLFYSNMELRMGLDF